jgi:hypothetical protein
MVRVKRADANRATIADTPANEVAAASHKHIPAGASDGRRGNRAIHEGNRVVHGWVGHLRLPRGEGGISGDWCRPASTAEELTRKVPASHFRVHAEVCGEVQPDAVDQVGLQRRGEHGRRANKIEEPRRVLLAVCEPFFGFGEQAQKWFVLLRSRKFIE